MDQMRELYREELERVNKEQGSSPNATLQAICTVQTAMLRYAMIQIVVRVG